MYVCQIILSKLNINKPYATFVMILTNLCSNKSFFYLVKCQFWVIFLYFIGRILYFLTSFITFQTLTHFFFVFFFVLSLVSLLLHLINWSNAILQVFFGFFYSSRHQIRSKSKSDNKYI